MGSSRQRFAVVAVVLLAACAGGSDGEDSARSAGTTQTDTTPTTNADGCYRATDLAEQPDFLPSLDGQEACVEGLMQALVGSDPLAADLREGFGLVRGELIAPGDAAGVNREQGDPCDYVRLTGPAVSIEGGFGAKLVIRPAKLTVLVPDAVERQRGGLCREPEGGYRPPG